MLHFEKLNINFNGSTTTEKWFKEFITLVPFMPALHTLIIEATKLGPINIDFVSPSALATGGTYNQSATTSNGALVSLKRSIKLPNNASPAKIIETLIFELCNAKNPYFQFFSQQYISTSNYSKRDDYARAIELAEYTYTHLEAKKIDKDVFSDPAIIGALRDKGIRFTDYELRNIKTDSVNSFNHWWQICNTPINGKNFSHADIYRQQFDKDHGKQAPVLLPKSRPLPQAPVLVPKSRPLPQVPVQAKQAAKPIEVPVVKQTVTPVAKQTLTPVARPLPSFTPMQQAARQDKHVHPHRHQCPHHKHAPQSQWHAKPVVITFTVFVGKHAKAKQVTAEIENRGQRRHGVPSL